MNPKISLGDSPVIWRGKNSFVVHTVGGYIYAYFNRGHLTLTEIHVRDHCARLGGPSDLPGADAAMVAVMIHDMKNQRTAP